MGNLNYVETAVACLANGRRLLEDAEMLEYGDPPGSSLALATIAQEEFAKGFLMFLVSRDAIPWNSLVYRATRDHTCKQLLGVVMSYMNPDIDEFLERMEQWRIGHEERKGLLGAYKNSLNTLEREKIWERMQEISGTHDALP